MTTFLFVMGILLLCLEAIFFSSVSFITFLLTFLVFLAIIKISKLEEKLQKIENTLSEISGKKTTLVADKVIEEKLATTTVKKESLSEKTAPRIEKIKQTSPFESIFFTKVKEYLFTGNPIAKIGVVILFFGVAFLFNYAIQHTHIPIEVRLIGVAIAGLAMIGIGWILPVEKRNYANIIQGGGIGLIYLTIYASFAYYHLLNPSMTFILLVATTLTAGILAILNDAKPLAIFGILGGFLAPILVSTGENNYIFLFTYYALLNIAILVIALFKSWRELNLIGFIFTFAISALWGYQSYQSDYFTTTQAFLIYFFLFYIIITLLFSKLEKNYIDTTLLFGLPIVTFCLQAGIVKHIEYGLAKSAFVLFLFYGMLAYGIYAFKKESRQHFIPAFTALAVLFGSLTIPLAFSTIWFISFWAAESVIVLWFGIRQNQLLTRLFAVFLLFTSTYLYIFNQFYIPAFLDQYYLSGILIVLANFACAYLLSKPFSIFEKNLDTIFFILGAIGWYYINLYKINLHIAYDMRFHAILLFFAGSSFIFWMISEYLNWKSMRLLSLILLPAFILMSAFIHPEAFYQAKGIIFTWLFAIAVLYFILYRHEKYPANYLDFLHYLSLIFITWFIASRMDLFFQHHEAFSGTWEFIAYGFVVSLMLFIINKCRTIFTWPLQQYQTSYLNYGGLTLTLFLFSWFFLTNFLPGNVNPLRYIPILNGLDLTIMLAFGSIYLWSQTVWSWLTKLIKPDTFLGVFCFLLFVWLNAVLLRTISQAMAIPYEFEALWNTQIVQTSFSIFWTALALVATFIAARNQHRTLWFFGFALIGIIVIKLLFIDLSGTNTISRIVAFIGVGILLLINGYISPLPPKK